jgi:hypothetical protein
LRKVKKGKKRGENLSKKGIRVEGIEGMGEGKEGDFWAEMRLLY